MRNLAILIPAILCLTAAFGQSRFKKNFTYFEIAGNGFVLSLNHEYQLGKREGLAIHGGVGLGGDKPAFPLGVTYLFALGNSRSFIETGLGALLAEQDLWDDDETTNNDRNPYRVGFIPSAGYRHCGRKGLTWKIIYSPVFSRYRIVPLFGGAAIGWRF